MELGNMLFGNSRGKYPFPDRALVNCKEWETLCNLVCDSRGHAEDWMEENETGGVTTETFEINPYYWGDCTCGADDNDEDEHRHDCRLLKHNFIYKPTGFAIDWYKCPFRDSYMSENLSSDQVRQIWRNCIESLSKKPYRQDAIKDFLNELSELTKRHGVEINGCGCCGSPAIDMYNDKHECFVEVGRFLEFDGEKYTIEEL